MTLQAYGVDNMTHSVPEVVEHFHNVTQISSSSKGILQETVYRGIKANDGLTYCLRRIASEINFKAFFLDKLSGLLFSTALVQPKAADDLRELEAVSSLQRGSVTGSNSYSGVQR